MRPGSELHLAGEKSRSDSHAWSHAPPGRASGSRESVPPPVDHFACGHDGERVVEVERARVINLCPACHERARHGALGFYQLRGLMLPHQ